MADLGEDVGEVIFEPFPEVTTVPETENLPEKPEVETPEEEPVPA